MIVCDTQGIWLVSDDQKLSKVVKKLYISDNIIFDDGERR